MVEVNMSTTHKARVTVSGSFHRHMDAISDVVRELMDRGARVLSPANPQVVDREGDFLFVASDRTRSVRMVQDRHLEAIRSSDFLWLVTPDGYVGQSASMEIGFAVANNVPIVGLHLPTDLTLRKYVHSFRSIAHALDVFEQLRSRTTRTDHFLIDPVHSIEEAQGTLERIAAAVQGFAPSTTDGDVATLYDDCRQVASLLLTPSYNID
jgi:hypothetical protein